MELYLEGEFRDIENRIYTVQIFEETDSLLTPFTWPLFGPQPLIVEHTPIQEDNFNRIITSQARVQFVAQTDEQAEKILYVQTANTIFHIRIDFQGELFYCGKILQDLGQEANKPLSRIFTVQARDYINEVFKLSSEKLIVGTPNFANLEYVNIPSLFARAMALSGIEDIAEVNVNTNCTWTNENNRATGFALSRNYLASYFLILPVALFSGQEEVKSLGRVGEIYSEDNATNLYGSVGTAVQVSKQSTYYTIGDVFGALVEALDLVLFYDAGAYWMVQREAWVSNSWYVARQTGFKAINSTPPLFGADSGATVNFNFTPQDVYAQGTFSGLKRAWKVRHLLVNQQDPIYDELVRQQGASPDYFFLHDRFNFPNGLSQPGIFLGVVNEQSFDAAKVTFNLDVEIDGWTGVGLQSVEIHVRIYTDNGQGWLNSAWVNNVNTFFPIASVSRIIGQSGPNTFNRKVEILIAPPNGITFTNINAEIIIKPFYGLTLNSVLANRAGRQNFIRGTVSAEEAQGGTVGTGGLVLEATSAENANNQVILDRGRLLYENVRVIKPAYYINTLVTSGGVSPIPEAAFGFIETWRRLNDSPDYQLAELRGREMVAAVRRVQKVLDGDFRHTTTYIGFEQPLVSLYGNNWRWIARQFDAKKGVYSGRMVEAIRQTGTGTFIGSPLLDRELRSTQLVDGSLSGSLGGGRLANDSLTTISAPFFVGDEDEAFSVAPVAFGLPAGITAQIFSPLGFQIGQFTLPTSVEQGVTTLPFTSLTQNAPIGAGSYVVLSQNAIFTSLQNSLIYPTVRSTSTATDSPSNDDHLGVVVVTDGITSEVALPSGVADGLTVTYFNDNSGEVAVSGNIINGTLTEIQPAQAVIFVHIGGNSWIFK
jgi:hypothetical protein